MSIQSEAASRGLVALPRDGGERYSIGPDADPFNAAASWHPADGRLVQLSTAGRVLYAGSAARAVELAARLASRPATVPRGS